MPRRTQRWLAEAPFVLGGLWLLYLAWRADDRWLQRHVLQFSFHDTDPELAAMRRLRHLLLGLGLFAVLVARPLVGRWAAARTPRAVLGGFLRMGLAVLLSFATGELLLRRKEHLASRSPELAAPSPDLRVRLCDPHPRYGWWFRPAQTVKVQVGGREIDFAIDAERRRAASAESAVDPRLPTILFAGESVAVGTGLAYEETFVARVARARGVQEVNLAAPGYGSDQAYLRLIDALPQYEHPVAVVSVFLPGMLGRNFQRWRPHLELGDDGRLIVAEASPPLIDLRLFTLFTEKLPYWSEPAVERSLTLERTMLRDTAARARARAATPLFVIPLWTRPPDAEGRPEAWILREVFETERLPYVVVDMDPRWSIPGDGHPDARASARIAEAIVAALGQGDGR